MANSKPSKPSNSEQPRPVLSFPSGILGQQSTRVFAELVRQKTANGGNAPTLRQLGAVLKLGNSTILHHLRTLVRMGILIDGKAGYEIPGEQYTPPAIIGIDGA